jgi:hypothetical protein
MALVRQAQEGDFQGDVAEGLFQLIAIGGRVVVIRRGCTTGKHGFGFVVVELKTDRIDPDALSTRPGATSPPPIASTATASSRSGAMAAILPLAMPMSTTASGLAARRAALSTTSNLMRSYSAASCPPR